VTAATLVAGCAVGAFAEGWGRALFGVALCGQALWLTCFDVARRTVRGEGLSRYCAVCLLIGYGWLGIAGAAWIGSANANAPSDIALHALGIGFIFSMILGHAPVVLPAVARIDIRFSPLLYAPLALLHATLVVRLVGASSDATYLRAGAAGNAIAIVMFAATIAGLARIARKRASSRPIERVGIVASS